MMDHFYLAVAFFVGVLALIVWAWRTAAYEPSEPFDREADATAANECIAASRPAELRPHVRAITEERK